nr:YdeI/OmpD-associated family protein [Candidatus Microthrix sp.]
MEAAGLMTDAGRRAVQVARDNGWWSIYDQVEDLIEPDQLREALDANPSARLAWDGFPPSARKMMLWSVVSAAQDSTRRRRIATIVAKAELGRRV